MNNKNKLIHLFTYSLIHFKNLEHKRKCIACGEEIDSKSDFCPKCGKEQPKVEETVEVSEETTEDIKDAEVTEIKDVEKEEEE